MNEKKTWTLTLNEYQRDNLAWLLRDLIGWGAPGVPPFTQANTGDWVGEIGWMLEAQTPRAGERPNCSVEELKKWLGCDWARK